MAFDFERYLQSYEPTSDDFTKIQSCIATQGDNNDEKLSNDTEDGASTARRERQNGEHLLPLDRLLGISSRSHGTPSTNSGGVDVLESRFRSGQEDPNGKSPSRGKRGLCKQTSLPVSLDAYCGSKKKETTGRRRRNSVRFADEIGENLTTFLLIPSRFGNGEQDANNATTTPTLNNDVSTLISDKNDISPNPHPIHSTTVSPDAKTNGELEKPQTPSFQLCFDQPAANLEDFRRRLFFQFVCLENVKVDVKSQADGTANGFVNHGTVLCTIKVRNLNPMKRVFARCTDNNWKTYADVYAAYVSDGTTGFNEYDTFTFALRNPLRYQEVHEDTYSRKTASVEFALCYEVLGSEYWDNNDGNNYRIVWM